MLKFNITSQHIIS